MFVWAESAQVFSMRENRTVKREGSNVSQYGSFVNQEFIIERLVIHLNILHNVSVINQHFCVKVNVYSVETVSLEFCKPETDL